MSRSTAVSTKRDLHGWQVLAMLAGFFGLVFAVNGVMAILAVTTFSGLDGEDSYRRGLDYNATLAEAEQQTRLGWQRKLGFTASGHDVEIALTDRAGGPVSGLTIAGTLGRGATSLFDRSLQFQEASPGDYVAQAGTLPNGSWTVSLEARAAAGERSGQIYRLKERLWLKTPQ
jgi:nitrogen fixation protein FixH